MIFRSVSNTDFRARVRTLLLAGSTALAFVAAPVWAFSIDDVASKAKDLAGDKYSAPTSNLPSEFSEMKFADYQQIRFINERAYWGKLKTPFKLSFYHQGMHFDTPVKINEVTATTVKPIKYDRTKFDFGSLKFDENATKDLGYAGFRVLYPINKADKQDEIATFLGASYFRVVGKGQVYGLSARGLAIDTALPSGEEFPRFREFWIERPKAQDKQLVIYALLDSPRATGAYRFVLRPGKDAVMDVQARVFLRDKVSKLGLAPLTSMYLFGSNQPSEQHNFRPELHDSSGLQIHAGNGEWLWRPLNNPKHLSVSTFSVENPKGFGLLQRGREFSRYEDLDDRYDLRPSAWIEPKGDWGKGTVELVEIPTPDETNDNIVAFWNPETQPEVGKPLDFAYRLHWTMDEDEPARPEILLGQADHALGRRREAEEPDPPAGRQHRPGRRLRRAGPEGPGAGRAGDHPGQHRQQRRGGGEQPALQPGPERLAPDAADQGQGSEEAGGNARGAGRRGAEATERNLELSAACR